MDSSLERCCERVACRGLELPGGEYHGAVDVECNSIVNIEIKSARTVNGENQCGVEYCSEPVCLTLRPRIAPVARVVSEVYTLDSTSCKNPILPQPKNTAGIRQSLHTPYIIDRVSKAWKRVQRRTRNFTVQAVSVLRYTINTFEPF